MNNKLTNAINSLGQGDVIAYPTEGVIGLGCDPFNEEAVLRLLAIKQRPVEKGLILIASDWQQLASLIQPVDASRMDEIKATGNTTWVFPATERVPSWIRGEHSSVAVRVTSHPIAKQLCKQFGGPIVSTSANAHSEPTVTQLSDLSKTISEQVGCLVPGETGNLNQATPIIDAITRQTLR
tara:strand:- start:58841 stop:59383 length:543 start_codon:yes stop_codon:yes gene_type:complete